MLHSLAIGRSETDPQFRTALGELFLITFLTLLTALVCARLELSEALFAATRRWEHLQLDELPIVLAVFAASLAWFAGRRYREARTELAKRRAMESRLERTLLENRRLTERYLHAQEAERKKLARELHDELGQYLNAIKTDAVSIQSRASDGPVAIQRASAAIIEHVDHVHGVVRDLIRRLRPVGLDELGLEAALEHGMGYWQDRLPQLRITLRREGELENPGETVSLAIYRLVQEGMTNIARHAAASQVEIGIARAGGANTGEESCKTVLPQIGLARPGGTDMDDEIHICIADDGRGADPAALQHGLGLIGMRERVEMLGGRLCVTTRPGGGFRIDAWIPVAHGETEPPL